jgi:hypothetical protein
MGWQTTTVDSALREGMNTSLELDAFARPHVSYHDDWNGKLEYAHRDATGWHLETVDDASSYLDETTSLELDGDVNPHVAYVSSLGLKYAHRDPYGWHLQTLSSHSSGFVSLVLDGPGYPHLSYFDYLEHVVKYAYEDSSGWQTQTIESSSPTGWFTSLALDTEGRAHISYYGSDYNGDLKYAYQDIDGWRDQTIDAAGDAGQYTSLALDKSGFPHISYYKLSYGDLRYAYQGTDGWNLQTIDAAGDAGKYASLALDKSGYPHISYHGYPSNLKYAYEDATGWHLQTVGDPDQGGHYTSLTLDDTGYPHISYYDWTNNDLKYAHMVGPGGFGLDGTVVDGALQLTWSTVTGTQDYWVYGTSNLPWFVPGMGPGYQYRLTVLPCSTTTWSSSNGIGDPDANWTYLVMAVDVAEQELACSNRVGEQDFEAEIP